MPVYSLLVSQVPEGEKRSLSSYLVPLWLNSHPPSYPKEVTRRRETQGMSMSRMGKLLLTCILSHRFSHLGACWKHLGLQIKHWCPGPPPLLWDPDVWGAIWASEVFNTAHLPPPQEILVQPGWKPLIYDNILSSRRAGLDQNLNPNSGVSPLSRWSQDTRTSQQGWTYIRENNMTSSSFNFSKRMHYMIPCPSLLKSISW